MTKTPATNESRNFKEIDFQLRFKGNTAEYHQIPAAVLAESIEALQKIVYVLAMEHEQRQINERMRVPDDLANRYIVLCDIPAEGSYAMPFGIGSLSNNLITNQDLTYVRNKFTDVLSSLEQLKAPSLLSLVIDSVLRKRLLAALRALLPKAGSGFSLILDDIRSTNKHSYIFDDRQVLHLRQAMESVDQTHILQTLTGRLEKIDFGERRLTIIYPPTNRSLQCTYDEGIEEMLYENRRALIQVTGIVTLDAEDNPQRMTDVQTISYLDLSSFEVENLDFESFSLRFRIPQSLPITLDESQQLLQITNDELGIHVFAEQREQLWEELREQIAMLWTEYAKEKDELLSKPALDLKRRLLLAIEEVSNDA